MNKILLTAAFLGMAAFGVKSDSKVYIYDVLGEVNGVSDNGHFSVVTDPDDGFAYLWAEDAPEHQLQDISAVSGAGGNFISEEDVRMTTAMDVTDDGTVVGSIMLGSIQHPAYYKDGKWNLLPLDPNARNTNEAVCVTPDGSVIAGYQFINDPESETGGRYYPCQWFRNEDGSYRLKSYTDIELPDHQGFFPLTQSPDGEIVAGTVYCGVQSRINAILKDGEMIIFEDIRTEYEPWMYRGKYYAGEDENGKQIWVEDIDDPRVVYFPEVYINGYKDGGGGGALEGFFTNCDGEGNLYGCRSRVDNVTEDGEGDVFVEAAVYNYKTDTWHIDSDYNFFSAGIGTDLLYTGNGEMIDNGNVYNIGDYYNVEIGDPDEDPDMDENQILPQVEGINKISADARVLGGVYSQYNEAIGQNMYFPFIVVTKEESGITAVAGSPINGMVVVTAGCIEVLNAEYAAVYDMEGRLVSTQKKSMVDSGIYIVKAGDATYKVIVR